MKTIHKILIILILQVVCFQQIILAQDTTVVAKPVKHKFSPETLKATMLAVSFPGLGQVYNRKYLKAPVVYAGFGALIYFARLNGKNYNMYVKAYQDFSDNIPSTNSYTTLPGLKDINPSTYDKVLHPDTYKIADYTYYQEGMLRLVDYYKRYRDLSYIGIAGWYLLSILDANVDASLFNYDVSNNLNITLVPMQMSLPGGFVGAGLSVDLKVNF